MLGILKFFDDSFIDTCYHHTISISQNDRVDPNRAFRQIHLILMLNLVLDIANSIAGLNENEPDINLVHLHQADRRPNTGNKYSFT